MVAGNGLSGFSGDGGPATSAMLSSPQYPVVDAVGNVYFADTNRIRKVDTLGNITTLAGTGTAGFAGDGSAVNTTTTQLSGPTGMAVQNLGGGQVNLYISDAGNNRIRKIDSTGVISTFAGTGTAGFNGDGIAPTAAQINVPEGLAFFGGELYIAEISGHRIRKVSNGISTVAGTGTGSYNGDGIAATAAQINGPVSVSFDAAGNMYICENSGSRIRMVAVGTGLISTVAGNGSNIAGVVGDGGPATQAPVALPFGAGVDSQRRDLHQR